MQKPSTLPKLPSIKEECKRGVDCKVYLKTSSIKGAGRGVFAACDLIKGVQCCEYDGYSKNGELATSIETQYMIGDCKNGRVGYIVPRKPEGVAQLINDAAQPDWSHYDPTKTLTSRVLQVCMIAQKYLEISISRMNACNQESGFMFCTVEPIKKDDELFFSYGFEYWFKQKYYDKTTSDEMAHAIVLGFAIYEIQRQLCPKITHNIPLFIMAMCLTMIDARYSEVSSMSLEMVSEMRKIGQFPRPNLK
jgi:hypothetical protein